MDVLEKSLDLTDVICGLIVYHQDHMTEQQMLLTLVPV